ncbi:MAG: hypothetical protein R3B93_11610 [Bacteroidia bacterium]
MKSKIITSLAISLSYFSLSMLYFFGGWFIESFSESITGQSIEMFITFPAMIVFGFGFSEGALTAYFVGFIIFLVIWGAVLILIQMISEIKTAWKRSN